MSFWSKISSFFTGLFSSLIDWVLQFFNSIGIGFTSMIANWLASAGLTIEIPSNLFAVLSDITYGVGYILPIPALMPIVNVMLAFYVLKIVFAVYHLIASTIVKRVSVKT